MDVPSEYYQTNILRMGEVRAVFKKLIGSDLRDSFHFFPKVSYVYIKNISSWE